MWTQKKRLSILSIYMIYASACHPFLILSFSSFGHVIIHHAFEQTDLQDNLHSSDIMLLGPHLDHGAKPRPHGLQVRRLPHLEQRLRDQRLASRQLLSVLKIFSTELKIFGTTQKIFVPVLANTASRGGSGSRRTRTRTSAACKCIWQLMGNQRRRQII